MTPHIEAEYGDIASTVLMPGDPLRAEYIAQKYLENAIKVNSVRGMYAYTGEYKGKKITVMASGMGMPSMGIYSYELFKFYDVENIIRIGSCGAYTDKLNLYDIILVNESYSESSYARTQGYDSNIINSSEELNNIIEETSKELNKKINIGRIHSTDVFYGNDDISDLYNNKKCMGVEMESFALLYNAYKLKKRAACILTVSDNLITKQETTSEERQNSFNDMMELALESAIKL